jgi:glutathione synthase/RimK-type ligase-like ATP-grasp enzyme
MILILTAPDDEHADHIAAKLQERAASFVRFNPAQFPREAEISLSYSPQGESNYTLRLGEEQVDLNSLRAVWYRRPDPPIAHDEIGAEVVRAFVKQECNTFVQDLWNSLDCRWLPAPPATVRRTQLKTSQLKVAGKLGFELPPTLVTNSEADLLDFYSQHNGNIVSKLAGFSFLDTVGDTFSRYTEMVTKRDIAYARAVGYCPMIYQAYVPKRVELRITVVGQQVFAAEIHSQTSNHTRHDWRRYDDYQTPHFPHELPDEVKRLCVELVERLGLCYGAIDMVLTPDGRYVFLEINPNGQYLWIEDATGLPISDAICDLLMTGASVNQPVEQTFGAHLGGAL